MAEALLVPRIAFAGHASLAARKPFESRDYLDAGGSSTGIAFSDNLPRAYRTILDQAVHDG